MTAPGLLGAALRRAAGWRLVALFVVASALPALLATLPIWSFLSAQLDHALRAPEVARAMDFATLADLVQALSDTPEGHRAGGGLLAGLLAALLLGPLPAGAALAAARAEVPPTLRELLRGAGEHYGRLLRMLLVAALPLGVGGGLAAALVRLARRTGRQALTEAAAQRGFLLAMLAGAALLWLAHLTVDAGRAQLAARPSRQSALWAWGAGLRLLWRQPLRALGLGLAGTALGLGGALLLAGLRQRLLPGAPGLVLGLGSAACLGWGHGTRLIGLCALTRADEAHRTRRIAEALRAASAAVPAPPPPPAPPAGAATG